MEKSQQQRNAELYASYLPEEIRNNRTGKTININYPPNNKVIKEDLYFNNVQEFAEYLRNLVHQANIETLEKAKREGAEFYRKQGIYLSDVAAAAEEKEEKTIKGIPVTDEEMFYYNAANAYGRLMPVANACLQDALHDFKMARNNNQAIVIASQDEIKNEGIRKALKKINVPQNSRGVYYGIDSKESKKIMDSFEIFDFVTSNYYGLKSGKKQIVEIEFESSQDNDLFLALHYCLLVNPRITEDGYFEGTVVDYYDFKHWEGDSIATKINNWGYSMQEKGILENYFVIFSLKGKTW